MTGRFLGKYRGKVESNVDTHQLGRLQVSVPAVLGDGRLSWAMPCTPYAGRGAGLFTIPPVGAEVWVEFEGGDTDYPIWSGCFWGEGEVPSTAARAETKILRTQKTCITLDDSADGEITIAVGNATIHIDANGIEISNGQGASIKLSGKNVSLNEGALEVT